MRGFDKLAKSAISPRKATNNPVNRLDLRMFPPRANTLSCHEEKEQRNGGDDSHRPKDQLYRTGGFVVRVKPFFSFHLCGCLSRHVLNYSLREIVHVSPHLQAGLAGKTATAVL
jgi:hypothetical protein